MNRFVVKNGRKRLFFKICDFRLIFKFYYQIHLAQVGIDHIFLPRNKNVLILQRFFSQRFGAYLAFLQGYFFILSFLT